MPSPQPTTDQKLSFTRDNRHQYLETAMVSAAESEREIMAAEARGRARRAREGVLKRRVQTLGNVLVVVAIGAIVGAVVWVALLPRLH